MWHRVTLPGNELEAALEQMRIMNVLSSSLLKMNLEVAQRVGEIRSAGIPVNLTEDRVEIYAERDRGKLRWLLNDAAMEAFRRVAESMSVEETFPELPPQPLGLLSRSLLVSGPLYSAGSYS